jgi:predicted nucleic acid-binding protein
MGRVDGTTRLFFDASCLIAAAASPAGGSGFLWSLVERQLLRAVVSQAILTEVETNLARKFPPAALARHRTQLVAGAPGIAAIPRLDVSPRRYPAVNAKDEHVVAAALAAGTPFILTLDRPLKAEINGARLGVLAVTPGEFIVAHLPSHPSFATLRDASDA